MPSGRTAGGRSPPPPCSAARPPRARRTSVQAAQAALQPMADCGTPVQNGAVRNPHPRTGLVLLLLLAAFFGSSAAARGAAMLPDLDQNPPLWSQIEVVTPPGGAAEQRLGFGSEVANRGVGPMLLSGSRPSTASEFMTASQKVQNDDGSTTVRPNVGSM